MEYVVWIVDKMMADHIDLFPDEVSYFPFVGTLFIMYLKKYFIVLGPIAINILCRQISDGYF